MIKRSCDFSKGRFSLHVTAQSGLVVMDIVVVAIKCF